MGWGGVRSGVGLGWDGVCRVGVGGGRAANGRGKKQER